MGVRAALLIVSVAAYEEEWKAFQAANGGNSEVIPQAFKDNVDKVKEINSQNLGYELSYTGPFAAISEEEFIATYTGLDAPLASPESPVLPVDDGAELDDAGHFPRWEHWKAPGRSAMVTFIPWQNSSWLIVTNPTMDARVVGLILRTTATSLRMDIVRKIRMHTRQVAALVGHHLVM